MKKTNFLIPTGIILLSVAAIGMFLIFNETKNTTEKENLIIAKAVERANKSRALRATQGGKSTYYDEVQALPYREDLPLAQNQNRSWGTIAKCRESINTIVYVAENSPDVQDVKYIYGKSVVIYHINGSVTRASCSGKDLSVFTTE